MISSNFRKRSAESIIRCTGQIVTETSAQLRKTARNLIGESKCVVLDLNGVNYLDSSGLGIIVGLVVSAKTCGCKLRFVNLTPRVKEILTMTRLMEVKEVISDGCCK